MKRFVKLFLFLLVVSLFFCVNVRAASNYYYSVDIGSDLEMSDLASPGSLDPGDIYTNGVLVKDDAIIFQGTDPWPDPSAPPVPGTAVPIGSGTIENYKDYFDMDGEDQLSVSLTVNFEGVIIKAADVDGLWKEPDDIYISFDDDQAPGWPVNDVPASVVPTHGTTPAQDEILTGNVWRVWGSLAGTIDEVGLGLALNPDQGDADDDDVDALDVEQHQYWYWTVDHEANYNLDPGAIYMTDVVSGSGGYTQVISRQQLGLLDDPITSNTVEYADVDAFEFCTTDDADLLTYFGVVSGNEYLAIVFSVDDDDPLTAVDESGGLVSGQLYISLLTGLPPLPLGEAYLEDIDAIALDGESGQAEALDFGDAPDPLYPTLLANNGARHIIGGPNLGSIVDVPDAETDGLSDPNALGDDNNNANDENGVWFPQLPMPMVRGVTNTYTLTVSGGGGKVQLWVDWNGNGSWTNSGEYIIQDVFYPDGTVLLPITAPTNAFVGQTFARCRISTAGGLGVTGLALDGEVEDHPVWIDSGYVQWCNLQWPYMTTTTVGTATENIYGRVYQTNVTDSAGQGLGIVAELGYGPDGTDPTTNATLWTWVAATYNTDYGNNDEYLATITVAVTGRYDYAYRYSRNGGDWSYGDIDSSTNGYQVANAGDLVVLASDGGDGKECVKWRQPPDCDFGLDLPSYVTTDQDLTNVFYRLADDWWCDGRPITAIRWWGSYIDNEIPERPSSAPVAFVIRWYTNVPTNSTVLFGHPGNIIKEITVPLAPTGMTPVPPGIVEESPYCLVGPKGAPPTFEMEFEYYLELEDPWVEKEGNIYWLNIEAVYDLANGLVTNDWGWATSSDYDRLNDAVVWDYTKGLPPDIWAELTWPAYPWDNFFLPPFNDYSYFLEPANEPSLDLAFEMLTDVCPARCKKWEQPPDMNIGMDMDSWRRTNEVSGFILRADDFISDGRPISDVHWWGSYIGWASNVVGSITNSVPWPTNANDRLLGFDLSWHLDDNGIPLVPPLTNIFVSIDDCYQVFYGTITNGGPGNYEQEYQYYVDLAGVAEPWYELQGTHYWINIQAVLPATFNLQESVHQGWGWVTTPAIDLFPSAYSVDGIAWQLTGGMEPPVDLAFELTTTEIPATNSPWYRPVAFTDMGLDSPGASSGWLVSTGGVSCGIQVLQEATNLLGSSIGWYDIATNSVPAPFPYTWRGSITNDMLFYQIQLRNN